MLIKIPIRNFTFLCIMIKDQIKAFGCCQKPFVIDILRFIIHYLTITTKTVIFTTKTVKITTITPIFTTKHAKITTKFALTYIFIKKPAKRKRVGPFKHFYLLNIMMKDQITAFGCCQKPFC